MTDVKGGIMLSYANRTATWFEETFPEAVKEHYLDIQYTIDSSVVHSSLLYVAAE